MHTSPGSIDRRHLRRQITVTRLMRTLLQRPDRVRHPSAAVAGLIADASRALQMTRILACALEIHRQGRDHSSDARVIIIDERSREAWAVPFDQILAILPYLEVAAMDALAIAQRIVRQTQGAVIGILQPGEKLMLWYAADASGMQAQTFTYARS